MSMIYYIKQFFILITIFFPFHSFSQEIDNSLISITLLNDYDSYKTIKKSKWIFPSKKDEIILVEQVSVQKIKNFFVVDSTPSGSLHLKLPDTIKYLKDYTNLLFLGGASQYYHKKNKIYECASFRIRNMPNSNDTAIFQFKMLNLRNNQDFKPYIYFSKRLFISNWDKVLNGRQFVFKERLFISKEDAHKVETVTIKLNVTRKSKKYGWIHIVTGNIRDDKGLIIPMNAEWLQSKPQIIDSLISPISLFSLSVLFKTNETTLSDSSKIVLDNFISEVEKINEYKISLQGFADSKGDLTRNVILAQKRVNSVVEYLKSKGILEDKFLFLKPEIGGSEFINDSRSCNLQLIIL